MDQALPEAEEVSRLLERARGGDRASIDELFARHRRYLRELVRLRIDPRLRPRVDPSDVIQEAQMEAARRLGDYLERPALPFRLWLRQIACDRLIMLRRRHANAERRAVKREVPLPERSSLLLARELWAAGSTPSERLSRREVIRRVGQALAELPEVDRELLMMRNFEGLSYAEISCLLQIDAAAARKRYGRALLRLRTSLFDDGVTGSQS
jgi:RNA polymerase sigma-70 factor (ECF subfamily)